MELSELVLHWYQGGDGSLIPEKAEAVQIIQSAFMRLDNSEPTPVNAERRHWDRPSPAAPVFPANLQLIRYLDTNRVSPLYGLTVDTINDVPIFSEFSGVLNTYLRGYTIPTWDTPYIGPVALSYIRGQARIAMSNLFSNGIGFKKGSVVLGADFAAIVEANPNTRYVNGIKLRNYSGDSPNATHTSLQLTPVMSSHSFVPFYSHHEYWNPATRLFTPCIILRLASTLQADYIQCKSGLRVWLKQFLEERLHRTRLPLVEFDRSLGWGYVYPQLETALRAAKLPVPARPPPKPPSVTELPTAVVKEIVLAGSLGTLPEKIQYDEVTKQLAVIDTQLMNYSGTKRNTVAEISRYTRNINDYLASVARFEAGKAAKEAELINLETNYQTFSDPNNLKRIRDSKEEALRAFAQAKEAYLQTTDFTQSNWIENLRIGSGVVIDDIYYNGISAKANPNTPKTMFTQILFHTLAPSVITVLNTGKTRNPVVIGGPYYVNLTLDAQGYGGIQVRPVDSNSIIGFHLGGTVVEYKFHPHTSPTSYQVANPQLRWDQMHNGCSGELTPILVEARNTDNPSLAVIGALGWLTTANGQDTYGRNWHWFPKPEEVKKWEKPDESPESLAAAASTAIVKARQEVEILSRRDREVAAELERETTRNVEEFTPPFARAMQGVARNITTPGVIPNYGELRNIVIDPAYIAHTVTAEEAPHVTLDTIMRAQERIMVETMGAQVFRNQPIQPHREDNIPLVAAPANRPPATYNPVTINIQGQE